MPQFSVELVGTVRGDKYVVVDNYDDTYFGSFEPTERGLKKAQNYSKVLQANANDAEKLKAETIAAALAPYKMKENS